MATERGTLFSTGGDESWPVTYRIHLGEPIGPRAAIRGVVMFPPGTRLRTLNSGLPVYLRLSDGRWASLRLPVEAPGETWYAIGEGSHLVGPPSWAGSR